MPRLVLVFCAAGLLALAAACQVESPPRGPEATCAKVCPSRASQCSPPQCARGCNLVIDRLAENEGDTVLACVAANGRCDDRAWAACATRVGPHADGGPPAPPPPPDNVDDEE